MTWEYSISVFEEGSDLPSLKPDLGWMEFWLILCDYVNLRSGLQEGMAFQMFALSGNFL